jgi:hypothetical protein
VGESKERYVGYREAVSSEPIEVEGSFQHLYGPCGSGQVEGSRRQHFRCLTINFGDMHRILDIFSIKAMRQIISANEEV